MHDFIKDWSRVDLRNKDHRRYLLGAFKRWAMAPDVPEFRQAVTAVAAVNHFTTKGDWPENVKPVIEKYHQVPHYDDGWQNIFDVLDFTNEPRDGFKIMDMTSGISFRKVKVGERVELYKMSGSEATVSFDTYGAGLGWFMEWFEDQQWWQVRDTAIEFQANYYYSRSQIFYDLIEALPSGQNIAWQAAPGAVPNTDSNYEALRDMKTINKACETILEATKDKGYGVTPGTTFILQAPIQLMDRVNRALTILNASLAGGFRGVQYNVIPQFTMHFSAKTSYYIFLPKRKLKAGIRMPLTIRSDEDILARMEYAAGHGRYAGAIGDVEQGARCATA